MHIHKRTIYLEDLGVKDFKETWDLQESYFQDVLTLKSESRKNNAFLNTPNFFFFVEHPHVYTLGKSGDLSNLLLNEYQLKEKGAAFYKINRGGDITYHGPGQIVGYPILDLENFFTDIHKYLRLLEETIILTLKEYGIDSERSPGETGVWLDVGTPFARKICALGVRASRWVTMHGFAFNVNANLGYFDNIIPCGIKGKGVTSLHVELGVEDVNVEEVKSKITKHFQVLFESNFLPIKNLKAPI
jgi:lipoyl(octanoyl) transferase